MVLFGSQSTFSPHASPDFDLETPPTSAPEKMASLMARLSPVPAFPEYTGPYKVGTIDIEIPVSDLTSPSPAPESADDLHTIQFRVFYPAVPESSGKRITWLPAPQRLHVSAYTQFLGVGPLAASVLSCVLLSSV